MSRQEHTIIYCYSIVPGQSTIDTLPRAMQFWAAMSRTKRAILFGSLSGLLWTFASFWFSSRSPENLKIFLPAGIATGILISLALYKPLVKLKLPMTLVFGILVLPVAAFCFGLCVGLIESIHGYSSGGDASQSQSPASVLYMGLLYLYGTAAACLKPLCGLILLESAVFTTWLLRLTLLHQGNSPRPS